MIEDVVEGEEDDHNDTVKLLLQALRVSVTVSLLSASLPTDI